MRTHDGKSGLCCARRVISKDPMRKLALSCQVRRNLSSSTPSMRRAVGLRGQPVNIFNIHCFDVSSTTGTATVRKVCLKRCNEATHSHWQSSTFPFFNFKASNKSSKLSVISSTPFTFILPTFRLIPTLENFPTSHPSIEPFVPSINYLYFLPTIWPSVLL